MVVMAAFTGLDPVTQCYGCFHVRKMKFMSLRRDLLDPGGLSASQYSFYTSYMPGTLGYSLSTSRRPSVGLVLTPGAMDSSPGAPVMRRNRLEALPYP